MSAPGQADTPALPYLPSGARLDPSVSPSGISDQSIQDSSGDTPHEACVVPPMSQNRPLGAAVSPAKATTRLCIFSLSQALILRVGISGEPLFMKHTMLSIPQQPMPPDSRYQHAADSRIWCHSVGILSPTGIYSGYHVPYLHPQFYLLALAVQTNKDLCKGNLDEHTGDARLHSSVPPIPLRARYDA